MVFEFELTMKIYCQVTSTGLVPMYDSDLEEKNRLKTGTAVLCDITRPRNYEFHKKFMALIRLTFDNLPERMHDTMGIYSAEDLRISIKLDLGLCSILHIGNRDLIKEESMSFSAMDQSEFEQFYKRSIDLILHKYLRGTDRQDLLDEIQRFK